VGLGLWAWYLDPAISAHWFDVPVFNYAAWFASPVLLVAITNLAGPFFRDWLMPRARRGFAPRGGAPAGWEGLLLLLIVAVVGFMFAITPGNLSPPLQWVALAGLLLLAAFFVAKRVRHFDFDCGVEATLTRPTALALTIPALALGVEGFFMKVPSLIPVAIFSISLGLLLAWLPCRSAVVGAIERTAGFDRFVRLHYFGFTAMLVLLGAAAVSVDPTGDLVVGLLLVAAAYHVFGYVLNDVVDLDLDRQQDRRGRDPLVRGSVSRESGLATALLAMPVIALIAFIMDVAPPAWLALAASLVLALVYNLWGKVTAVPPLTDAIQGLAWALLGLFAAWSANASLEPGPVADRLVPVLAYCGGFIFLINGIHGGLRDLWTDLGNGKKTSATFFGARPSVEDPAVIGAAPAAESSLGVQVFAFAVHSAMFAPMFWFLVQTAAPREGYGPLGHASASLLVAGIFVVSNVVLWRVVRRHEPQRGWWISSHLFVLLLPPLALYLPADFVAPIFKVLVAVCFFVPLLLQVGALERLARFLRSDRDPPPPPAPPWAGSTRDAPPPPPPAD
jgi:4-hydroxybenzoate polyprenyltransferase